MSSLAEIRETPIEIHEVETAVAHAGAGAIVHFVGRVRDHNDGRPVTRLEYEAYASMATREMQQIVGEIEQRGGGIRLAVLHRIGSLNIGDAAVVCAASAPHRGEAFDACRMLIDEIKARVPIWKREHGPDGPYWVGWEDARCTSHHAGPSHAQSTHHTSDGAHGRDQNQGHASQANPSHAHPSHEHDPHHDHHGHSHHPGTSISASLKDWRVVCVTVSDTRRVETDGSGAAAEQLLGPAGAQVDRRLVRDEIPEIQQLLRDLVAHSPDAILLTGGTGIGPRDVTCEAVQPLLTRQIDGFGETFRRLSFDEIGTRALLSRAIAGTIGTTLLFVVPGSPAAVRLALQNLVIPLLPHARAMIRGGGH